MRRTLWSMAFAGVGFGCLAMVGGTAIGDGGVGALAVGYGFLVLLSALYLLAGLAIRDRVARTSANATSEAPTSIDRLAGHRVF